MTKAVRRVALLALILGAVLLLTVLFLVRLDRLEDRNAGQASQTVRVQMEAMLADASPVPSNASAPLPSPDSEMPTVTLDGYDYVGQLAIPSLRLELPVMSEWDQDRLRIAPCRQFGSSRSGDLVIAAHNYESHFGLLEELREGAEVTFTDMDGLTTTYAVDAVRVISPTDVDSVRHSGYALVLYTCTYGGRNRVAVFCRMAASGDVPKTPEP